MMLIVAQGANGAVSLPASRQPSLSRSCNGFMFNASVPPEGLRADSTFLLVSVRFIFMMIDGPGYAIRYLAGACCQKGFNAIFIRGVSVCEYVFVRRKGVRPLWPRQTV